MAFKPNLLMIPEQIEKNFVWEANLPEGITYIPMKGKSEATNFRSPDSFVVIFFEKCSGWHSVDFVKYESRDNQVHISLPGQIHSWETEAGSFGHKLILSKQFVEVNLHKTKFSSMYFNKHPIIDLPLDVAGNIFFELNLLNKEKSDLTLPKDIAELRGKLILSIINTLIPDDLGPKKQKPLLSDFFNLIESNFDREKSVSFYADKLLVSPNYLNILTKRLTGITAKETIDSRVVLEAKRLLLGSKSPVKEIAFKLGFSSQSSFSSFIRKKTGIYPKNFRI